MRRSNVAIKTITAYIVSAGGIFVWQLIRPSPAGRLTLSNHPIQNTDLLAKAIPYPKGAKGLKRVDSSNKEYG